jgi:hypothetical protein
MSHTLRINSSNAELGLQSDSKVVRPTTPIYGALLARTFAGDITIGRTKDRMLCLFKPI